jgi:hypothetical protein
MMAHVKSIAHPVSGTAGSGGVDCGSEGSKERTESTRLSNTGSCDNAGDVVDCSRSFLFRPSTVTVSWIHGMIDSSYFAEGMGRKPREETVLEPQPDEAAVFEEFFTASLRMAPHLMLADILLKFQIQIHQLTSNAIAQLSKYIWTVSSLKGVPSAEGFAKRYELHVKCGGQRVKLTMVLKNKWSGAWTQAWFYCKVFVSQILSPR